MAVSWWTVLDTRCLVINLEVYLATESRDIHKRGRFSLIDDLFPRLLYKSYCFTLKGGRFETLILWVVGVGGSIEAVGSF